MRGAHAPSVLLAVLILVSAGMVVLNHPEKGDTVAGLQTFKDYSELRSYLDRNSGSKGLVLNPSSDQAMASEGSTQSHSTTNVQVSGVQEEDRVLTDGTYIFSAGSTSVSIIKAIPASGMTNMTSLNMSALIDATNGSNVYIAGIFLIEDRLVVICQLTYYPVVQGGYALSMVAPWYLTGTVRSTASVFDVSDPSSPVLERTIGISGSFTTGRALGNDLYIFSTQYAWDYASGDVVIPSTSNAGNDSSFAPEKILYDPQNAQVSCFLNLVRIDVADLTTDERSFLTGYSSVLYMSQNSIFVTYSHYSPVRSMIATDVRVAVSTADLDTSYTTIFSIDISGPGLNLKASGTVRGTVVDRYAIDEKDGFMRIATTDLSNGTETLVSVLSSDLKLVGQVGGIGMGETMQSSRYIGDTLYLVTFRQVDPLFAIDLSDPRSPTVLGELTIPGFSTYLHPVDSTHLLGLGFEGHSMKVSLYNVSDRTNPVEEQKLLLSDFSYSPALYDPHAVTYDPVRSLLIVPVSGLEVSMGQYQCAAYIFNTSGGISLKGMVGSNNTGGVDRTLYIGDSLYVCSQYAISAYGMTDLAYRGGIVLESWEPFWYYANGGAGTMGVAPEIK
jgi:inhibitor of cysteine peptidase